MESSWSCSRGLKPPQDEIAILLHLEREYTQVELPKKIMRKPGKKKTRKKILILLVSLFPGFLIKRFS
jgi:hypothetical protein